MTLVLFDITEIMKVIFFLVLLVIGITITSWGRGK